MLKEVVKKIIENEIVSLQKKLDKIQNILKSNEAYSIVDKYVGGTWSEGGCGILAFAMNILYNYPVFVIFNQNKNVIEHFLVKVGNGLYFDSDGVHNNPLAKFRRFETVTPGHKLLLMKFNSSIPASDIILNNNASEKLSEYIKKMLSQ